MLIGACLRNVCFRWRVFYCFLWCLQLTGDKILGIAKFFLGIGIPGDTKNFFDQVDSLACLENNRQVFLSVLFFGVIFVQDIWTMLNVYFCWCRVSIPLILSLPSTVISLTKKDSLKVWFSSCWSHHYHFLVLVAYSFLFFSSVINFFIQTLFIVSCDSLHVIFSFA